MSYEVTYRVEGTILAVRSSGKLADSGSYQSHFVELQEKLKEHGCNRLLIDSRAAEYSFDTLDVYRVASADALAHRAHPLERFAILTVRSEEENVKFYENVAYNRGLKVKFFYDEDEAWEYVRS